MTEAEIHQQLKNMGHFTDDEMPMVETALLLSALTHAGRGLEAYRNHIKIMAQDVTARFKGLMDAGADDNAETRIAALKHIIADKYHYTGNTENYNDLNNADVIEVIDNRKGLPITLALIVLEVGRAQGWNLSGINFPGHFFCRLDVGGQRVMFDPFENFKILQASDLRFLLKKIMGDKAELSMSYYQEASNRDILLRLQNNIKFRQIESEHYAEALDTISVMRLFAPQEYRLLLDDGVLKARLDKTEEAIQSIRDYLAVVKDPRDKFDAEVLLRTLERSL